MPHVMSIQKITGVFGAEITGFLASEPTHLVALPSLLHTHGVVVLREAHVSHATQVALARSLGEPTPAHPVVPGHPDHPEILELDGARGGKNASWHTDVTFMPTPPAASVLVADELPAVGGDTMFADMRAALATLSSPLRTLVEGLAAVHRITPLAYWGDPFDTALSRADALELLANADLVPPVAHPVVRIHPVTGVPSLFVNPGFTSHIIGLSRQESAHLLALLFEHATRPEMTLRHRWQPGDVVMWDNQATMHYAIDDYGSAPRRMRRVTVRGQVATGPTGISSRVVTDPLETMIGSPTR